MAQKRRNPEEERQAQQSQTVQDPQATENVLVTTSFGNEIHTTLYPKDTSVYTYLGGDVSLRRNRLANAGAGALYVHLMQANYFKKKVADLKEGEQVLWDLESIDAKLEEENPLYAQAKSILFVDAGGRTVPRLQYELLVASENVGLFDIDKKTLDDQLSENSISAFELRTLDKKLRSAQFNIYRKHKALWEESGIAREMMRGYNYNKPFLSWLQGEVVSPVNLAALLPLAVALEHQPLLDMYNNEINNLLPQDRIKTFKHAARLFKSMRKKMRTGEELSEMVLGVQPLEATLSYGTLGTYVKEAVEAASQKNYSAEVGELEGGENALSGTPIDANDADLSDKLYAQAESQLFVDVGSRTMPRLQYELLKACAEKGMIDKGAFDKWLQEGSSSASEFALATTPIWKGYSNSATQNGELWYRIAGKQAVRSWFSGAIVSPSRLETLRDLGAVEGFETFKQWYADGVNNPDDVNTFWGAKKLFYRESKARLGRELTSEWKERTSGVRSLEERSGDENLGTYVQEAVEPAVEKKEVEFQASLENREIELQTVLENRETTKQTPFIYLKNAFNYLKDAFRK